MSGFSSKIPLESSKNLKGNIEWMNEQGNRNKWEGRKRTTEKLDTNLYLVQGL